MTYIICACAILSSCTQLRYVSAASDMEDLYSGKSYTEIIDSLGVPARIVSDGHGGKILTYEVSRKYKTSGYGSIASSGCFISDFTTVEDVTYISCFVNGQDICYKVDTNLMKVERESQAKRQKELRAAAVTTVVLTPVIGIILSLMI